MNRYVITVTETRKRTVVIDSMSGYSETRKLLDRAINENNGKILNDKHTLTIRSYNDDTENVKSTLSERKFNNLIADFKFLTDENEIRTRQYAQSICELFENILEKHDITVPDPDRDSQGEGEARIYGETYFNLEDEITNMITEMVNKVKRDEIEVVSDTY